jgi:hypothetical protein
VRGWVIRIGIVALIAIGIFVFRDRLSSSAGDLAVGDCFDEPAVQTEIKDVQRHPCNEAHTAEVIFVGNMTGANETYPSDPDIQSFTETNCIPAYNAYTGRDFESDAEITIGWFYPTTDGWKGGDRGVLCYAIRIDEAPTTQSMKKAP